jgi:cytochrome c oxidase subunit 2
VNATRALVLITSAVAVNAGAAELDLSHCTVCHGANGNGNIAIRAPKIAGMEPWYVRTQLERFGAGLRGARPEDAAGHEMRPVAAALKDTQTIEAVVTYVESLRPKPPPVTITGNVEHGRSLYASCAGCHGSRAEGNAALQAPALAGQSDWYLVKQLEHFRDGVRGFSPTDTGGSQMRAAATVLTDSAAIRDVVAYINTLR